MVFVQDVSNLATQTPGSVYDLYYTEGFDAGPKGVTSFRVISSGTPSTTETVTTQGVAPGLIKYASAVAPSLLAQHKAALGVDIAGAWNSYSGNFSFLHGTDNVSVGNNTGPSTLYVKKDPVELGGCSQ